MINIKSIRILVILTLVLVLLFGTTACTNSKTSSENEGTTLQASDQSSADQQTEAIQAESQAQSEQITAVSEIVPTADPIASADSIIGNWIDINTPDNFADIIKTDNGFEYKDNDGKYTAAFKDGVLKVNVSDSENDTADVYIDTKTGHLISVYDGAMSEYSKKQ